MKPYKFQQKAIDELAETVKKLWHNPNDCMKLIFESPTGSGKTFMVESLIQSLNEQANWFYDICFVWISFSDDLVMQSRDKFIEYFYPNVGHDLLTVENFDKGVLDHNDILFFNWQKLVSKKASDRLLRRPDDDNEKKETGYYFEDVIENTHQAGRQIILIIDESHKNVTDSAWRDVITPINPKIIIEVSATPEEENIPSAKDLHENKAGYVVVDREDVVKEGLIKEAVVSQTEEDLLQFPNEDQDTLLLKLAIKKRNELVAQIKKCGVDVNPLILIQLPNDDHTLEEQGIKTKQEIVLDFLHSQGITDDKIAFKFSGVPDQNMEGIKNNNAKQEFMLFKFVASTGWDCPRAQILVMYRDIKSSTFYTQTLGRIVRIPIHENDSEKVKPFRKGYLYTNYKRNEVAEPFQKEKNKPLIFTAYNKLDRENGIIIDDKLVSDFIPRADYGDLGKANEFQKSFINSFNTYFGIHDDDFTIVQKRTKVSKKLTINSVLTNAMIVDAVFDNFEDLNTQISQSGKDEDYEISRNDVERMFTALCSQLLLEQTETDVKVSNIARSWSPLKSALRVCMLNSIDEDSDKCYRIFINDVMKEASSVFRECITQALKDYRPVLNEHLKKKREEGKQRESETFVILPSYSYSDDYEALDARRCILDKFYLRINYDGKENETKFYRYLEQQESVEWWFKNGDQGKDFLSIKYYNSQDETENSFYPDWIIKLKDGTIGIFDTKAGNTAKSMETKDKAKALQERIDYLNSFNREDIRYVGGIVVMENGQWYYNDAHDYNYIEGHLSTDWKNINVLFK